MVVVKNEVGGFYYLLDTKQSSISFIAFSLSYLTVFITFLKTRLLFQNSYMYEEYDDERLVLARCC